MKKILKKKVDNLDFYKIFKPELTPKRMMELGVFGGSYFGLNVKEYPKIWFKNVKISKTFDVNLNRFKVVSGLSREHWIEKGWIFKEDPLGWFQWYCRYTNEKRIPLMITSEENLDFLGSSNNLNEPFKRTTSRLYELTSKNYL